MRLVVVGCFKLESVYECVCVCVFAGMHNNTKPIQCREGMRNLRGEVGRCCKQCMGGSRTTFLYSHACTIKNLYADEHWNAGVASEA